MTYVDIQDALIDRGLLKKGLDHVDAFSHKITPGDPAAIVITAPEGLTVSIEAVSFGDDSILVRVIVRAEIDRDPGSVTSKSDLLGEFARILIIEADSRENVETDTVRIGDLVYLFGSIERKA